MGWLNAAASIIGGLYANKQAKKAVGAATDQANIAYQQSLPQQYTGMFGGYDPDTGEFLNQDMQNLMQQYMEQAWSNCCTDTRLRPNGVTTTVVQSTARFPTT
jgi:hypothetical protein